MQLFLNWQVLLLLLSAKCRIFYVIGVKLILNIFSLRKNEMLYGCKQKGRHHARRGAFTGDENSVSDATGTPWRPFGMTGNTAAVTPWYSMRCKMPPFSVQKMVFYRLKAYLLGAERWLFGWAAHGLMGGRGSLRHVSGVTLSSRWPCRCFQWLMVRSDGCKVMYYHRMSHFFE